jgi:predicted Zn-dependent protease
MKLKCLTVLLIVFLVAPAFAQRSLTPAQETEMGRVMAQELEQNVKLKDDAVVVEYVNRVAQNIVRNSDAKVAFTVRVIDSDEVNAFALPGGFFYVNTGLILAADNEAEFAAAIAHQVAHVTAQHGLQLAGKTSLVNVASIPLMNSTSGIAAKAIQDAAKLGVPLSLLAFSRANEIEADYLGLQYLYKAGYSPSSMSSVATKFSDDPSKGMKVSAAFSTHPPTTERLQQIQTSIAQYLPARNQNTNNTPEFDAIKARLKK